MDSETPGIEPIPMELSDEDRAFLLCYAELERAAASCLGVEFHALMDQITEARRRFFQAEWPAPGERCSFCRGIIDRGSEHWLTRSDTGERIAIHRSCHVRILDGFDQSPFSYAVEVWLKRIGVTAVPVSFTGDSEPLIASDEGASPT